MDTDRLGICVDLADPACAWEQPADALAGLRAAGLPVVKIQVSAAVESPDPADPAYAADDLDAALDARLPGAWRVHYHVPLHAPPEPPPRFTVPVLREALAGPRSGPGWRPPT
ncbi:hypothetical protein ACFFKH_16800 [Micromonospora marina]|uniref:Xylose isomerase-like TIM barrel n=1 Tax=Micromonospora marina TaxID=307120 RepID=A0A1C4ZUM0_9ACTN|nr:hypothetical protein GA0070215_120114 [Micromonospora marina]